MYKRSLSNFADAATAADRYLLLGVALSGCLLVALMLLTSRPDLDDVGYLYEALHDAANLERENVPFGPRNIRCRASIGFG